MRSILMWVLGLGLAACGSDTPAVLVPDEYIIDCDALAPDAGAATFASDENWNAFVNAEAAGKVQTVAAQAPALTVPAMGATLSAATPPTFTFKPTPTSAARTRAPVCHAGARSALAWLGELVEGTAEAHCGAFTGENYVFRVTAAGSTRPLDMAVLSVTTFSPDATKWKTALAGRSGQTVAVTIERGIFFRGDISEGPYVQTPYPFVVGP
jgi:hypothetical protein